VRALVVVCLGAALAAGCSLQHMRHMDPSSAFATLAPTKGNSVRGTVSFTQDGGEVHVRATLTGLKPNSDHGFHVHENGDCSSGDGMSAGGHYNPSGQPHGPQSAEHHAGDMPNIRSDLYGNASAAFDLRGVSVGGTAADLVGRALIVDRDRDDYTTQPTGNSGPRIACAVIARS
jgi:superoxide dismutase, Cu-Zn family